MLLAVSVFPLSLLVLYRSLLASSSQTHQLNVLNSLMCRILSEDKAMVEQLRPDLLQREVNVKADGVQTAFRRLRQVHHGSRVVSTLFIFLSAVALSYSRCHTSTGVCD